MSRDKLTKTILVTELCLAVAADEKPEVGGFDISAGLLGPNLSQFILKVAAELEERAKAIDALKPDAVRWRALTDACGSYHDGSMQTVKLHQDDATRTCIIDVGTKKFYGSSFKGAIAEMIKSNQNTDDNL